MCVCTILKKTTRVISHHFIHASTHPHTQENTANKHNTNLFNETKRVVDGAKKWHRALWLAYPQKAYLYA
jgi:hypothetical protein